MCWPQPLMRKKKKKSQEYHALRAYSNWDDRKHVWDVAKARPAAKYSLRMHPSLLASHNNLK